MDVDGNKVEEISSKEDNREVESTSNVDSAPSESQIPDKQQTPTQPTQIANNENKSLNEESKLTEDKQESETVTSNDIEENENKTIETIEPPNKVVEEKEQEKSDENVREDQTVSESSKEEPPKEENAKMETDENENSSKAEKTEEVVNNDQEPQQTDQLTKLDASQTDISSDDKEEKVDQVKTESSSPKSLVLPTKLFDNVRYHILNTKNSEIERLLDENGAYKEPYLGSLITHVICDDPADNSDYSEAKEVFDLTIIKSEWVVKCIETNSLLPTEPFAHEHSSHILSKCTFLNVNVPSEIALKLGALISFYGGKMRNVDRVGEVSHAFSCLYDESTKRFGSVHASVKLITPAWLVDSLLAGKLLDEAAYSPKYLRNNPDLASVIESIEDDSRKVKDEEVTGVASEPQPTTTTAAVETKTQHKISLFVTPHSNQPVHQQTAPTTVKLPDQITPATNNLSTVAANQMASPSGGTHQSAPVGLKTTPPHQQQPQRKRPRKQSNNNPASIDEDSSKAAAFTSDMNEIFQSVISASQNEEKAELAASKAASAPQHQPQPIVSSSSSSTHSLAANNIGMHHQPHLQQLQHQQQQQQQQQQQHRVVYNQQQPVAAQKTPVKNPLPLQFELTQKSKQGATSYFDAFDFTDSSSSSSNNNELSVQENAHLITFDCCLLGCVFYVKPNESHYTSECVQDWTQVIERFGGRCVPDYDAYAAQITHVICSDRFSDIYRKALGDKKRTCTIFWLEDVLQEQKMRQPWLAYHFPSPHDLNNGPLKNHIISTHGFTGKEKLILRTLICLMGGKYTNYLSNVNTYLICREQEKADSTKTNGSGVAASGASKVDKARKWGINVVNGVWLNELYLGNTYALTRTPIDERYRALDVHNHLYYDGLLVHEFMEQWKQLISLPLELIRQARMTASSPLKQANRARYTRLLSPSNSSCAFNTSARADSAKIPRIEGSNGTGYFDSNNISEGISWMKPQLNIPCVMFTGIDQTDVMQYQKDVISLGGVIAKQPSQATYLIVNKIERTAKLLKCISTCEYIVNIKWLLDSKMVGKFCDPNNYQVVDERFEKHYGCNLKESMARARERKFLLSGLSFYLSPSVRPSHQDLTEMIKSAGGNVLIDAQRVQHFQEPFNDLNKTGLTSKCVVIGSQKDISILKPFIDRKIPIYNEELILSGLLKQKLEANLYKFYTTQ